MNGNEIQISLDLAREYGKVKGTVRLFKTSLLEVILTLPAKITIALIGQAPSRRPNLYEPALTDREPSVHLCTGVQLPRPPRVGSWLRAHTPLRLERDDMCSDLVLSWKIDGVSKVNGRRGFCTVPGKIFKDSEIKYFLRSFLSVWSIGKSRLIYWIHLSDGRQTKSRSSHKVVSQDNFVTMENRTKFQVQN